MNMKRTIKIIIEQYDNGITYHEKEKGEGDIKEVILESCEAQKLGQKFWSLIDYSMICSESAIAEVTLTIETPDPSDEDEKMKLMQSLP